MFPWNNRRTRRIGRDRFRPAFAAALPALEGLEERQLMAYSPIGFSLPDLTVSGYASTAASWGGTLTVTVTVSNIGAATIVDPLSIGPAAITSADAPPSVVEVFATHSPHSLRGAVPIGAVNVPAIAQNSVQQITSSFTLPQQPPGLPGDGGKVYLYFKANATGTVPESDTSNNVSGPVPLLIEAPLPELAVVGFDVPPVMQPGDVIQPNIRVANFGPNDTAPQGIPVYVALVASTTPNWQPGFSSVLAVYSVANIPGEQNVSSPHAIFADANQTPQLNVVTIAGAPVKLPTGPAKYYIGVVVDPLNQLKQLGTIGTSHRAQNRFSLPQIVGPPIEGLPPAGQIVAGGAANVPVFPFPFGGKLVGGSLDGQTYPAAWPPLLNSISAGAATTTTTTTTTTTPITSIVGSGLFTNGRRIPQLGHPTVTTRGFTTGPATNFPGLSTGLGRAVALNLRLGRLGTSNGTTSSSSGSSFSGSIG